MTACVNKKSKRVAAVVTASLVGALSIGAPAVALAANANIDMLAVDWNTSAKVTKATDGTGAQLSGDLTRLVLAKGKYMVPTEISNVNGDTSQVDLSSWTLNYYSSDKSTLVATTDMDMVNASSGSVKQPSEYFNKSTVAEGTYYVEVVKGTSYDGEKTDKFVFKIADAQDILKDAYAFEGTDASDKEFAFTGAPLTVGFAKADGTKLDEGTDYSSAVIYNESGAVVTDSVTGAGAYTAQLLDEDGAVLTTIKFTVAKFDVAKAALSHGDVVKTSAIEGQPEFLKNVTGLSNTGSLKVDNVKDASGKPVALTDFFKKKVASGKYAVTISAASGLPNFVEGSGTVSFYVLDKEVDAGYKVTYNGKEVTDKIEIDLTKGEKFDASKVAVAKDKSSFSGDQIEVSFKDKNGNAVTAEDIAKAGTSDTFKMVVRVVPFENFEDGKLTGKTFSEVSISVKGDEVVAGENVAFYLNGELAGSADSVTYDGTDHLEDLTVAIKANGKTYEQGKDYTLEVKCDGKVVTEAVDHGEYEVTVKPITFTFGNDSSAVDTFSLTVDQVTFSNIAPVTVATEKPADSKTGNLDVKNNAFYVAYTGKAVQIPALKYETVNQAGTKYTYTDLDSSLYSVLNIKDEEGKVVKEAVDAGKYTVTIAATDAAAKNYNFNGKLTFSFEIKEFGHFKDVDSAEWYSVPVEQAWKQFYINGISGTQLFAPNAEITRADAICIIFNMAGGDVTVKDDEFSYSEDKGYVTGFSDVDGKQYFGKALAWAKAAGVANGSNGQFRPYDKIIREEFAALLCNFAKSKGEDVSVNADEVLGSASDYTAWAKNVVAWAKANGIMGNNGAALDGTGNITRAQVAAMAVNYQPDDLLKRPDRTQ